MIPAGNTVPYSKRPVVTLALIGACFAAFAYQLFLPQGTLERFLLEHALVPARYLRPSWAATQGLNGWDLTPFVTNMFLHGGILHILSNMWTLWVFGPALEERLGAARFAALYLMAGFAAGALHVIFNFSSTVPALGASGAIAGIVAAYARRFPYAWVNIIQPILIFPVFFALPAIAFAGLWFLTQVLAGTMSLFGPSTGGGIAWWAHIGGFLAGWWLVRNVGAPVTPGEDAAAQTQSMLWPWTLWWRWLTWWTRR